MALESQTRAQHLDESRGVARTSEGCGKIFFLRFQNLYVAKRHAAHGEVMRFAKGFGACSPEKFLENGATWCVLVCILIRFCL